MNAPATRVKPPEGTQHRLGTVSNFRQDEVGASRFDLSFSSEEPVRRFWGIEILDHGPGSVRMSRLESGRVAFLMDHANEIAAQVGVVEAASVSWTRGSVQCKNGGDRSRPRSGGLDVAKHRRQCKCWLHQVHAMQLESSGDDGEVYRVTDWEPVEVSLVSVPADSSVGVGRSATGPGGRMFDDNGQGASGAAVTHTRADVDTARAEAQTDERDRVLALRSLGKTHAEFDGEAIAESLIASGGTIQDLFRSVRERQERAYTDDQAAIERSRSSRGMPSILPGGRRGDDPHDFSFRRLILQGLNKAGTKGFGAKELSRDCLDWQGPETERTGESNRGKLGPCFTVGADILGDVRWPGAAVRELTSGTGTNQGGNLIAQDFLESEFVALLRNSSAIVQHARILADLVGDVEIPKQLAGRAATWLSETGALSLTDPTFSQLTLSPKELGAATQYTRKLLLQSSPDIEMLLRMDLAETIALGLDAAAINGSGSSNQPTGILNTTGIGSVSASGTAVANKGAPFTWADIVALETEVALDNAMGTAPLYVMNAAARGHAKTTLKGGSASDAFIWDNSTPSTPVNGHMTSVSNQLPTNLTVDSGSVATAVLFGDAQNLTLGLWSGIDIEVNPYLKLLSRQIQVVAYQDVDLVLKNAESWAAIKNAYFGS